jgi:Mg-chelatase subunit ChlD
MTDRVLMGFIDYAWEVSVQKDQTKVKILKESTLSQPTLERDSFGFTVKLPVPAILEGNQISYIGNKFSANAKGKIKAGRIFRASVLHTTTHTLLPLAQPKNASNRKETTLEKFAKSLTEDICVNEYLKARSRQTLADIAYANAVFFCRIKTVERIFSPATKLMTALLSKVNVGEVKGSTNPEQMQIVDKIYHDLSAFRKQVSNLLSEKQPGLEALIDEKVKLIGDMFEPFGPFLEVPSLYYGEHVGNCSIYSEAKALDDVDVEATFWKSMATLDVEASVGNSLDSCWRKEQEMSALQAFDSEQYQADRREKTLSKIRELVAQTKFKSVSFPEEDYTQYLRARGLVQGASRRLLDSLRSALDTIDEDPRQEMGQLDLTAVIQAIASNKPATDVFSLEEYLKQSFAWSIIFDVSGSMKIKGEIARALAIATAEAAKELMNDPTSWTFFAFNDKFHVLKANNESYSKNVRSRIGGLKFEGLTYMPDAIQLAGKMLAKRFEDQRVLVVISDGWPYGYTNMPEALKNTVEDLLKKGVIVIGVGVETDRMGRFFKLNASVYTQKDLIKKFGNVFNEASSKALET